MYTPPLSTGLSGAGPRLRAYLDTLPELTSPSRRAALYADLSLLRDTNPYAYERALSWWQQVVVGAARAGATSEMPSASNQQAKQCVFCVLPGSLAAAFERDGIRPAALVTVLVSYRNYSRAYNIESNVTPIIISNRRRWNVREKYVAWNPMHPSCVLGRAGHGTLCQLYHDDYGRIKHPMNKSL
jgi:hypothetical protein